MGEFFARDYHGAPFQLFGTAHLIALGIVFGLILLVTVRRHQFSLQAQKNTRIVLAIVLVINELAWHAWNYFTGQWTIQTMLPFHLCSVLVWTSALMLITRNYAIYEYAYFLGIGGAVQALITPDAGIYGFPHMRFFQTFISHGTIMLSAIYMTLVEGYRPTWKSLRRVFVGMNAYMLIIAFVNRLIGSNYLFIARPPETASLIDVLGPWPWYILSLEAIGIVLCLLLYLPYAIRDRKASLQAPLTSSPMQP